MAKVAAADRPSKVWTINPLIVSSLMENTGVDNPAFYDSESGMGSKDETFQKKHPYFSSIGTPFSKKQKSVICLSLAVILFVLVLIVTAIVLLAMKEVRLWQTEDYPEVVEDEGISLVEGYLRITNRVFTKDLLSPHNPAYRKLSIQITQSMDTVFLHSLQNYNETRVIGYKEGSVIVRCLIHFTKPRMDTTHQVGMAVVQALERHHGYLPGGLLQVDIRTLHFTGLPFGNDLLSDEETETPASTSTTTTTTTTTAAPTTSTEAEEPGDCRGDCEDGQVCLYLPQTAFSRCLVPRDPLDPTGCGGWCVSEHQVCKRLGNATFQCADNIALCKQGEWKCYNGLCIDTRGRCNGKVDCYDMSDEIDCECGEGRFLCGNSTPCLPLSMKCDGRIDCWDASDEVNCTARPSCGHDNFTCNDGSCVGMSLFCDRFPDCPDGSDEPDGCGDACLPAQRPCLNGRCVGRTVWCDGVDDCRDGSDEGDCSNATTTAVTAKEGVVVTTPLKTTT